MAVLSIRLDEDMKDVIEQRADEANLSISDLVKRALQIFLEDAPIKERTEEKIKLSLSQRLQFINQYRILALLDEETSDNSKQTIEALENGYELHYSWMFSNVSKGISEDDCELVLNILTMYSELKIGFMKLDTSDDALANEIEFPGFDGNNETSFMGYARYFVFSLGRFEQLQKGGYNPSFNSHRPMTSRYRLMLPTWQKYRETNAAKHKYVLSEQQIRSILSAPSDISKSNA